MRHVTRTLPRAVRLHRKHSRSPLLLPLQEQGVAVVDQGREEPAHQSHRLPSRPHGPRDAATVGAAHPPRRRRRPPQRVVDCLCSERRYDGTRLGAGSQPHTQRAQPRSSPPASPAPGWLRFVAYESDGLDPNGELSEDARMSESQVRGATTARTKDPYSIDAVRATGRRRSLKEEVPFEEPKVNLEARKRSGFGEVAVAARRCRASAPFPMGHRGSSRGGRHAARCALAAGLSARRRRLRIRCRPRLPKSPTDQDLQFVKRFVLRTSAVDVVVDENGSPREPRDNGGLSARESGASTISALSDSRRSPSAAAACR